MITVKNVIISNTKEVKHPVFPLDEIKKKNRDSV